MRILVLSNLYPPLVLGGYERLCSQAVARWRAAGHDVTVLTTRVTRHRDHAADDGVLRTLPGDPMRIATGRAPRGGRVGWVFWHLWSAREVRRALETCRPDLVTLWGVACLSRAAVATLLDSGTPNVAIAFDYGLVPHLAPSPPASAYRVGCAPRHRAIAPLRQCLHLSPPRHPPARWVFCSNSVKCEFERTLGPLDDALVVHHGVDVPSERPPLKPRSGRLRVGAVGRLVAEKGFHTLLAAVSELADEDPRHAPSVEIRGPGQDPAYLARLRTLANEARDLGTEVHIGPPIAGEALHDWLIEKDCIAVVAEWPEPFSLMPLHAMAAGRPVIGTSTGGAGELLEDGVNAIVVPPGDSSHLARAMRTLADDPALGERLADSGFERVRTCHRRRDAEARLDAALMVS
jgi:glycogen(starch) synthase